MFTGTDGVDVIIGPHTKGVYAALTQSAKYFVDLCGVFQDTFLLELDGNVHDLFDETAAGGRRPDGEGPRSGV